MKLEVGQQAPPFTIDTLSGSVSLCGLLESSGKGVVVYFYPRAGTPGCTTEACDFRDSMSDLKEGGYTVIGISPDSLASLEKFADKQQLNFLLGSDPSHEVLEAYGAWGEKKNYGRTYEGVIRSTFVVNKKGEIEVAMYNVRAKGHVGRVKEKLGSA